MNNISNIEKIIKMKFVNKQLLLEAITHKSYAVELGKLVWNERLEFLGDSVLSLIVADYLYSLYPNSSEGYLSRLKSQLVSRQTLTKWSKKLNLGEFILLSKGEEATGGRKRDSILSNAFESLLGAIYLEKGFEIAKKFVVEFLKEIKTIPLTDYKSKLQELIQAKYKMLPVYKVAKEYGPEHEKNFIVEVYIKNRLLGTGKGRSKKEAEQNAAKNSLGGIQWNTF
ncbi:MAG: ribonuclease III [Elusimicrobiota bacterium]|nr:ribonuclease III [Elusimicrobiota bacterium]